MRQETDRFWKDIAKRNLRLGFFVDEVISRKPTGDLYSYYF